MVEAIETFPGVTLWEKFDDDCKRAEAARDEAVEDSVRERDRVVNSDPGWKLHSRDRINALAKARYDRKVKEAQEACDALCARAQEELMRALDDRERARSNVRYTTIHVG